MKGTGGSAHFISGITASTIRPPGYLQFCPLCAVSDQKQYGEMFWHRLHQISGVEACPIHTVFLEKSSAGVGCQGNINEFISAKRGIQVTSDKPLDLLNPCHQNLLKIAQDTAWLLDQESLVCELKSLQNRYLYLLAKQRLATYGGKVYIRQLLEAFINYYSPYLLKVLQCEVDKQSHGNWLSRLVRLPKGSQHPLRHLLLMHFLGYTAEEVFNLPGKFQPFGEGPWPCFNPVCPYFQQLKVRDCQIKYNSADGTPIGIFSCECGFVYSRNDFKQTTTDQFQISKVRSYGYLWERALRNSWENSSLSLTKIGHQLGVCYLTVKEHAIRLGLSFPRQGSTKLTQLNAEQLSCSVKEQADTPNKFEIYRNEWLLVLEQSPNADRTSLRNQSWRVYSWLRKHDSDWLEDYLPPRRRNKGSPQVDWKSRDVQLAEAVRNSAVRLKNVDGRPIRITRRAIGRDINQVVAIQACLNKLPLTAKILDAVVETREAYTIRRIWWVAEDFRRENIYPTKCKLEHKSGINSSNGLAAIPQVQKALNDALQFLKPIGTFKSENPFDD
jgi:hypothetical protein